MKILIDNGHGKETPGKRSPEGLVTPQILEWSYARRVAAKVVAKLKSMNIDAELLVPEDTDVPLNERCKRANRISGVIGKKNVLLVSIHLNAASIEKARGWEVHTYFGQSISDVYAKVFWEEAAKTQMSIMRGDHSDGEPDWDSNFAILRDTICPSVLTENLFMTNKADCEILNTEMGFQNIVNLHVNAILRIIAI